MNSNLREVIVSNYRIMCQLLDIDIQHFHASQIPPWAGSNGAAKPLSRYFDKELSPTLRNIY